MHLPTHLSTHPLTSRPLPPPHPPVVSWKPWAGATREDPLAQATEDRRPCCLNFRKTAHTTLFWTERQNPANLLLPRNTVKLPTTLLPMMTPTSLPLRRSEPTPDVWPTQTAFLSATAQTSRAIQIARSKILTTELPPTTLRTACVHCPTLAPSPSYVSAATSFSAALRRAGPVTAGEWKPD